MIVIVDYGMGNLGSVLNMFKKIGARAIISGDIHDISQAEKILLPGVGSFDTAMKRIHESGLYQELNRLVIEKKIPVLGICLGMQLLMEKSEEGLLPGFGWIEGGAYNFKGRIKYTFKVPHMGWNDVLICNKNQLTEGFADETRFYFVHSYFVRVENESYSLMKCNYGLDFDAAVCKENIYGAQFHPEKSHKFGMQLFKNFAEI
jgi:imidazole glycerol-phosphate synthase subunit HisH